MLLMEVTLPVDIVIAMTPPRESFMDYYSLSIMSRENALKVVAKVNNPLGQCAFFCFLYDF